MTILKRLLGPTRSRPIRLAAKRASEMIWKTANYGRRHNAKKKTKTIKQNTDSTSRDTPSHTSPLNSLSSTSTPSLDSPIRRWTMFSPIPSDSTSDSGGSSEDSSPSTSSQKSSSSDSTSSSSQQDSTESEDSSSEESEDECPELTLRVRFRDRSPYRVPVEFEKRDQERLLRFYKNPYNHTCPVRLRLQWRPWRLSRRPAKRVIICGQRATIQVFTPKRAPKSPFTNPQKGDPAGKLRFSPYVDLPTTPVEVYRCPDEMDDRHTLDDPNTSLATKRSLAMDDIIDEKITPRRIFT